VIAVGNYEFFIERTVGSAGILPADFVRASRLEAGATKALASISHDSPYLWRRVDPADSGRKAAATRHAQPIWSPEVELVAKLWRSPSQLRASNAAPLIWNDLSSTGTIFSFLWAAGGRAGGDRGSCYDD
jgi:hypothetical protein